MSVARQTTSSGIFAGSGSNIAGSGNPSLGSITQDADCDRVFICVQHEGNDVAGTGQTTTDMTCAYDGVSATLLGTFKTSETVQVRTTLFQVLAASLPAAGSGKSAVINYSGTAVSLSIAVVLLTGASQAAVDGQNISGTNTDGDISQNVNVAEADSAVLFFGVSNNAGNVSGNRTQLFAQVGVNSTTTFYGQIQTGAGTGNQSQTVDFATNPNRTSWAGVAVRSAPTNANLTVTASFTSGAATAAATASRGREASASFSAGSATAAATLTRVRQATASFLAGATTLAASAVRGHPATASFTSSAATLQATAEVGGNKTLTASFSAGAATMAATASRGRTALAAFQAGSASLSTTATVAGNKTLTAAFAAGGAALSAMTTRARQATASFAAGPASWFATVSVPDPGVGAGSAAAIVPRGVAAVEVLAGPAAVTVPRGSASVRVQ